MFSTPSRNKQQLTAALRRQPVSFSSNQPTRESAALSNGAFQRQSCEGMKIAIGPRNYGECPHAVTFDQYTPQDSAALETAIHAAYRHVFGNRQPTNNQRQDSLEAKLKNGELTVRGFVNGLAKSSFYKDSYFHSVSPQRGIELNLKHVLGRPPVDKAEVSRLIIKLAAEGYDAVIDSLTDSAEYTEVFGNDTVPYPRSFISMAGVTTSSFNHMVDLESGAVTSDNALGQTSRVYSRLNGNQVATSMKAPSFNVKLQPASQRFSGHKSGALSSQVRFRPWGCK